MVINLKTQILLTELLNLLYSKRLFKVAS